jgi:lysophospholipase
MPNTNSPDPNFGKCMQCVAIDRARYKLNPLLERSSFCAQCFQQYCFDPDNLTSSSELPGRKLGFVDPDPQGVSAISGFLSRSKIALILSFIALLLIVAGLSAFLCVYFPFLWVSELIPTPYMFLFGRIWRKRRARGAEYHEVKVLHDEDEPPFFHHNYRDSSRSEMPRDSELNHPPDEPDVPEEPRR